MALSSKDLSTYVFKRTFGADRGEVSVDPKMLGFLIEFDGQRSLGDIANKLGMSMADVRPVISRLLKLRLIEQEKKTLAAMDAAIFTYLIQHLSLILGPFARIMVEDAVSDMGYSPNRFPVSRAPELVETLAESIDDEGERNRFTRNMIDKIKGKGVRR